ncbi:hypothetical protein T492DRAFT_837354 [Pavlovales sp. CCMP2436]|nr:hypothetical protein T492DRAFT_837354 [Pavlovales sp. CCMP2436]
MWGGGGSSFAVGLGARRKEREKDAAGRAEQFGGEARRGTAMASRLVDAMLGDDEARRPGLERREGALFKSNEAYECSLARSTQQRARRPGLEARVKTALDGEEREGERRDHELQECLLPVSL